jgi:octaheme c-type cytochrome (tetrathionate reductase family)
MSAHQSSSHPHPHPQPVHKRFFTPGTFVLLSFMAIGFSFGLARFLSGLGAVTNLGNSYPWGIWKAINVAVGVALAASGFTSAALIDIFGREKYHSLLRPAILTAWLGYIMVGVSLVFDLGRYWNIWQPIIHWQGNSVLFEVAMCVIAYLVVLTFEISPSLLEGLKARMNANGWDGKILRRLEKPITTIHSWVKLVLPIFIVAGFVLSCMHHSSLGTLVLIAPTKLSPLWFTPLLPVLFLISSMMVGFPMVIMESILAGMTYKYKPNMEILGSLAAKVPWLMGIYLVLKLGDLVVRWDQLNFFQHPNLTLSLVVEIMAGVMIPFILLLFKRVRRSPGLLLFSVLLIIGGVVLNRLNAYLVGFYSPFAKTGYFPSIGEMALSLAIISTIIFFYRFFTTFFPVLPAYDREPEKAEVEISREREFTIPPFRAWVVRAVGASFLLGFVFLYTFVHKEALAGEQFNPPKLEIIKTEKRLPVESVSFKHDTRPLEYRNIYMLNSLSINPGTDYYEPVRFSHRTHDVNAGSDCSVCHHRVSADDSDKVGEDLRTMHASIEVRIGGACATCHADLKEKKFQKCSVCHIASFLSDYPSRIGLMGAYHRQCIGCHAELPASANAPTECNACHRPLIPDHKNMVAVTGKSTPQQITAQCLICHPNAGKDVLKSAHWNWKGLTPSIDGHEHSVDTGLLKVMDNYTITMRPDLVNTSGLHIGYQPMDMLSDTGNVLSIDCLVCHDTTGKYRKDPGRGGLPMDGLDLREIATKVGRPSRYVCGQCHFYIGGGPNIKHGDLEPRLAKPAPPTDVHMGMVDMKCQDCHQTVSHQIAGVSFMSPVTEGRVTCEKCHGSTPHGITGYLSRHLDDHVRTVSCETCHVPFFAGETPTRMSTDFSTAGQDRPVKKDALGMPDYDKKWGSLTWGKNVTPVYRWYNGNRNAYVLGDKIFPSREVELNAPLGEKYMPDSRIFPFKAHTANQPYDSENNILAAVKFEDGFWKHFNWDLAIKEGMEAVGLNYSGKYGFVKTRMYTSIPHGVVPARQALGCSDCHKVEAITCSRCHKKAVGMDQPSHTRMVYPEVKNRMDFKALGYEDDPAFIGGRFYLRLGRGKPPE